MRIIITGGSGFIGQALSSLLLASGHTVIALSRSPGTARFAAGVQSVKWDAVSAAGWGHLVDADTAVVHLAGESVAGDSFFPRRWSVQRKELIMRSRVQSGQAVMAAVRAAREKPAVVVQGSAVGFYGTGDAEQFTERSPSGSDFMAQVCRDWEASTDELAGLGVRRVIARIGLPLNATGGVLPRFLLPYRLFAGGPFGSGKQYFSWIHMADLLGALRFLIEERSASGAFNLTAPQPVTNAQFGSALGSVLHRPSLLPVPRFAFQLAFGEVATVILDGPRVMPAALQAAGYKFKFADVRTALQDLLG
ncbi:MAG: hypothetical protein RLY92_1501 [Chloroflexota bacterium]